MILANRYSVELAPLQIYSSAIIFAPQTRIIRTVLGRVPSWIQRNPITPPMWNLELQKLEGHTDWVNAVAFSQDGSLLASASYDQTIRLWNPATGQETQKLEEIGFISRLDFANDDENLLFDHGTINFKDKSTVFSTAKLSSDQSFMRKDNWIRRDDSNFLWLPQEYRDCRLAFYNNTLAFGLSSGQVSILQFLY